MSGLEIVDEAWVVMAAAKMQEIKIFALEHALLKLKQSITDLEQKLQVSEDKVSHAKFRAMIAEKV